MKEFVLGFYHFVSGSGLEQHLFKPLPLRPPSVRVGSISPGCTTGPQHTVEHYYQKFGVGLVYSVVSTYEKHFKVKQRLDKSGVFCFFKNYFYSCVHSVCYLTKDNLLINKRVSKIRSCHSTDSRMTISNIAHLSQKYLKHQWATIASTCPPVSSKAVDHCGPVLGTRTGC